MRLHRIWDLADHSFLFVWLLPVFFTLHGWNESLPYLELSSVGFSLIIALGISAFFFLVGHFFRKEQREINIFSFLSAAVIFFYPVADNDIDADTVFSRPLIAGLIIFGSIIVLLFFLLKGWLLAFRLNRYLNILFLALVVFELLQVSMGYARNQTTIRPLFYKAGPFTSQQKWPPIYLIVMDEYAGINALQRSTGYNNKPIVDSLHQLGFYVANASKSNYDYTILSLASMFNGMYMQKHADAGSYDNKNYKPALRLIKNNRFVNTLTNWGYKTVNLSPLDLWQQRRFYHHIALPGSDELIFQSTILWQGLDLLPMFIARRLPGDAVLERMVAHKTRHNMLVMDSVLRLAKKTPQQVFCYAHLMMPHAIYARDSSGRIAKEFLRTKQPAELDLQDAYLQYLVYTNKVLLPFTQKLIELTKGEAVILLLSDHGSRHLFTHADRQISFENLLAVYYPNREYGSWYPEVTNINALRILLSDLSANPLPLMKDSLVLE